MYTSGEKPGPGTYVCQTCFEEIEITDNNESLPDCPVCGAVEYSKKGE